MRFHDDPILVFCTLNGMEMYYAMQRLGEAIFKNTAPTPISSWAARSLMRTLEVYVTAVCPRLRLNGHMRVVM